MYDICKLTSEQVISVCIFIVDWMEPDGTQKQQRLLAVLAAFQFLNNFYTHNIMAMPADH